MKWIREQVSSALILFLLEPHMSKCLNQNTALWLLAVAFMDRCVHIERVLCTWAVLFQVFHEAVLVHKLCLLHLGLWYSMSLTRAPRRCDKCCCTANWCGPSDGEGLVILCLDVVLHKPSHAHCTVTW